MVMMMMMLIWRMRMHLKGQIVAQPDESSGRRRCCMRVWQHMRWCLDVCARHVCCCCLERHLVVAHRVHVEQFGRWCGTRHPLTAIALVVLILVIIIVIVFVLVLLIVIVVLVNIVIIVLVFVVADLVFLFVLVEVVAVRLDYSILLADNKR